MAALPCYTNCRRTQPDDHAHWQLSPPNPPGLCERPWGGKGGPGFYFIGGGVNGTGWLGGYNFQWAWSSGWVAGQFV